MSTCPLCQHRFEGRSACHGCGMVAGCQLICCPQCGYEFVESSKTESLIKGMFKHSDRALPLSLAPVGADLRIISTDGARASLARLTVWGILPGQTIHLLQRRPSFVVRAGETEIALDREIAGSILVEPID